ncbi:MAG: DNA repair protein [Actinomycetes bacterium]
MVLPSPLPTDPSGPAERPASMRSHPSAHRPAASHQHAHATGPGPRGWVDAGAPVERVQLDERSWVDVVRGLVPDAERVHHEVLRATPWRQGRSFRYERWVDDTRLSATVAGSRRHPALAAVETWLVRRYRVRFSGVVLTQYRDARESLGFHRDTGLTWLDDTLVAVFTLGAQRSWFLRPDTGRQRFADDDELRDVVDLAPSGGDLLVMGGACQRDWLHAVPPSAVAVGGRISAQWRWASRRGEPDLSLRHRDAWRFTSAR